MEQQPPWSQQQREGGGYYAMGDQSSCHAAAAADLDQATTTTADLQCEVDAALLTMELMEDLPSSADLLLDGGDGDRQLSHVMRSLEAAIGGGDEAAVMMTMPDDKGCGGESLERIDAVFPDDMDDGYDQGASSSSSFEYWPQMSSSLAGHDEAEGWCVYTADTTSGYYEGGGVLGYDDTAADHHYYYCCAEASADHMYLPLWE